MSFFVTLTNHFRFFGLVLVDIWGPLGLVSRALLGLFSCFPRGHFGMSFLLSYQIFCDPLRSFLVRCFESFEVVLGDI